MNKSDKKIQIEDRSFVNRVVGGQSAIRRDSRPSKKRGVISWKLYSRERRIGRNRSVIYFPLVLVDRLEDLNDHLQQFVRTLLHLN